MYVCVYKCIDKRNQRFIYMYVCMLFTMNERTDFPQRKSKPDYQFQLTTGMIVKIVLGFAAFIVLMESFTIIGGGERGVIFSRIDGVQPYVFDEGFHFKKPFIDKIIKFEVRTLKATSTTVSTSNDQQIVNTEVVLNFHLYPDSVNDIYQKVGMNYGQRIVIPAMEGSIKSSMALFKAEDLIRKRDEVNLAIVDSLKTKLFEAGIIIDAVNIVNIDFSDEYDKAIEAKVTAEQEVEKEKNVLDKELILKEQKIVRAEANKQEKILTAEGLAQAIVLEATAEAEALRIKQEAAKDSDEVLRLKYLEVWDGHLPRYLSDGSSDVMLLMNEGDIK